jgi:hypothetical protein
MGVWTGILITEISPTMNGAITDIDAGLAFSGYISVFGVISLGGLAALLGSGWFGYEGNGANNTENRAIYIASMVISTVFCISVSAGTANAIYATARMRGSSGLEALISQAQSNKNIKFI